MTEHRPVAEPRGGITGQFEIVTAVVRVEFSDRLIVTKHVFTFRGGLLVAVSEPMEEEAPLTEQPPPLEAD